MKLANIDNKWLITSSFVLPVLLVGAWLVLDNSQQADQQQSVDESVQQENPEVDDSTDPKMEDNIGKLPKPLLNKSSGNNGPIPTGVLVNFTCTGGVNTSCQIILTNSETSKELKLETKQLEALDRGQPSAVWTWESVTGTWEIVAIVTADGYDGNTSNVQELIVE